MASVQELNKREEEIHVETQAGVESKSLKDNVPSMPISAYASLSALAVSRTFWKAWLFAGMAAFGTFSIVRLSSRSGATFDGYAVTIPGSIIANPGFVQAFGTATTGTGQLILDANHVGAWGGSQSGGQIVGMLVAPFVSDRFGRRLAMLILSVLLVIVSQDDQ